MAFWRTLTKTAAHLAFAVATTAYIVLAIHFEERYLVAEHGHAYAEYRRRMSMLPPRRGLARAPQTSASRAVGIEGTAEEPKGAD